MNIVFLDSSTLGDVSFEPVEAFGRLVLYDNSTPEEAVERVRDCEVLIVNKIKVDRNLIDSAPSLKLICEAATGINNIDVAYAAEKNIPVMNVAGYSTDSVVQTTFMHILALYGHSSEFDGYVKSGRYSASGMFTNVAVGFNELAGKTMGIIGLGNIGNKVALVARAFGMNVVYFSTSGTSHSSDYPSLELAELLSVSDIVSIHAPYNERTAGLIGEKELSMMKRSALLINMGRGGIVSEQALADAISEEMIAGAALDVFETEPLEAGSPLLDTGHMERLILSPHIAWASREARTRLVMKIAENIGRFAAES